VLIVANDGGISYIQAATDHQVRSSIRCDDRSHAAPAPIRIMTRLHAKMPLKYQHQVSGIPNCPANQCRPGTRNAFRWVHSAITHTDNFRPAAVQSPARLNAAGDRTRCSLWALSFFTSLEHAEKRFRELDQSHPRFRKKVGGWVAQGTIHPADGTMSPPSGTGHFELHEDASANLAAKFTIVRQIP